MQILQLCRNITLSINIQAAQSNTKPIYPSQNSLLDTPLHCREKKPAPPTRTSMQATLTSKPQQTKHSAPPTGRHLHNKKEPLTTTIQTGHPKHNNLNKMKGHRNAQQVKEHEKCPPSQTKEEEIGNLPEKEFRIMIKIIQNLENKMQLQINSLETRIEKIQETFNKDLEEIKKSQLIMNNAINETKNTLQGTNSRKQRQKIG